MIKFKNPAKYHKVPCLCVEDDRGKLAGTIWQIGENEFFFAPGKKKPKWSQADYLGTMVLQPDGMFTFLACDPTQPPSHFPVRKKLENMTYTAALMAAYGVHVALKKVPAKAALPRVRRKK